MDDVEIAAQMLLPEAHPFLSASLHEGDAEIYQGAHALGMQQSHIPDDDGAPVVTDEQGVVVTKVIQQCGQIAGEVINIVVRHDVGSATVAVSALIRRNNVIAQVGEHRNLMPPAVGMFWPAVAEDGGFAVRSTSGLGDKSLERYAIYVDHGCIGKVGVWKRHGYT